MPLLVVVTSKMMIFDQVFKEKNINMVLKTAISSGVKFVPGPTIMEILAACPHSSYKSPERMDKSYRLPSTARLMRETTRLMDTREGFWAATQSDSSDSLDGTTTAGDPGGSCDCCPHLDITRSVVR